MGWAQLGRLSTPHGAIRAHSPVCNPVGLAGADGLAYVSGGACWPSAGPLPPRASHPPGRHPESPYVRMMCTKRARPGLGSHNIPSAGVCWPGQVTGPVLIQREGKNSNAELPGGVSPRGSLATVNITMHPRTERDIIRARVYTFSAGPLNSKALKEPKILFTFVAPIATPVVLSTQWVFNKFMWID